MSSDGGTGVVFRLAADATVRSRTGSGGRPVMAVTCDRGKVSVSLSPGVVAVETLVLENGSSASWSEVLATSPGGSAVRQEWRGAEGQATLTLPRRQSTRWIRELERAEGTVALSYTPFASESVVAPFTWTGFAQIVAPYRSVCGLK